MNLLAQREARTAPLSSPFLNRRRAVKDKVSATTPKGKKKKIAPTTDEVTYELAVRHVKLASWRAKHRAKSLMEVARNDLRSSGKSDLGG